jgi:hypothetical protein
MAGNPENTNKDVLTGIHSPYTVSANPEPELREADKIMINNLLNTLAEVALSIASRESDSTEVK